VPCLRTVAVLVRLTLANDTILLWEDREIVILYTKRIQGTREPLAGLGFNNSKQLSHYYARWLSALKLVKMGGVKTTLRNAFENRRVKAGRV